MRSDKLTNRWMRAMEFLRRHDVPCPSCSYNLRGNTKARCPECGTEFDPIELTEAAPHDISFGELVSHPWLRYGLIGANVVAWIVHRFREVDGGGHGFEVSLSLALVLSFSIWDATERSFYDAELINMRSILSLIVDMMALGLSRVRHAIVWAPLSAMALTLVHIVYVTIVR